MRTDFCSDVAATLIGRERKGGCWGHVDEAMNEPSSRSDERLVMCLLFISKLVLAKKLFRCTSSLFSTRGNIDSMSMLCLKNLINDNNSTISFVTFLLSDISYDTIFLQVRIIEFSTNSRAILRRVHYSFRVYWFRLSPWGWNKIRGPCKHHEIKGRLCTMVHVWIVALGKPSLWKWHWNDF